MLVNKTIAWDAVDGAKGYSVVVSYVTPTRSKFNFTLTTEETFVNLSLLGGESILITVKAFVNVPNTTERLYGYISSIEIATPHVLTFNPPTNLHAK